MVHEGSCDVELGRTPRQDIRGNHPRKRNDRLQQERYTKHKQWHVAHADLQSRYAVIVFGVHVDSERDQDT